MNKEEIIEGLLSGKTFSHYQEKGKPFPELKIIKDLMKTRKDIKFLVEKKEFIYYEARIYRSYQASPVSSTHQPAIPDE